MRGYQIYVKTNKGWALYGKTPISAQAQVVKYQLEQKGCEVKIKNLAETVEF